MLKNRLMKVQILLALGAILLASCGGGNAPEATPTTMSVDQIQTLAVATFSSALTMTALVAPTNTPAATQTPPAATTPIGTSTGAIPLTGTTPGAAVGGVAATASCYGLTFVSDVTIPDNTQMDPGETFTKTWKVKNSGSCAWDAGFKFQNTGGEALGSAITLPAAVAAGQTYDISVPMTAPTSKTGTLRSNWRMSTAAGQYFGDEVFAVIVVGNATAPTDTSASTEAPPTSAP
jgi:hypothetical protein